MSECTSLIVKHIPLTLTLEDQEELLKLFGAKRVCSLSNKSRTTCTAFATFSTNEEAKHALTRLHQMQIFDQRLVVEFAKPQHQTQLPKECDFPAFKAKASEDIKPSKPSDKEQLKLQAEEFAKKLHGMCYDLSIDYLPSPLLKYNYPPPTAAIIANISHALVAVPKFYTQVLHLMNKMHLPAPFGPVTPAPPLSMELDITPSDNLVTYEKDIHEVEEMDTGTEEEESEIESDHDDERNRKTTVVLPTKPILKAKSKKGRKEPQYHHFMLPSAGSVKMSDSRTEPSDVFESQPMMEGQKKIQFNIRQNLEPKDTNPEISVVDSDKSGFGIIEAPKHIKDMESTDEECENDPCYDSKYISYNELRRKRISSREMKTVSAFKNYSPGEPTVRLYIKNLARQVEEKDLRYVFGRFIDWDSDVDKNMFDIRLMKEGRMKGQAFVTLANERQAIEAVRETNGYVLHTKPLVVQFARSAKPKEAPQKTK